MKIWYLFVFLSLISLTSFSQEDSVTNRRFLKNIVKESIPNDILKDGYILLVECPEQFQRGKKKTDKENGKIKEIMDSIYKGQYLLVTRDMHFYELIKNNKVYRYTLNITDVGDGSNVLFYLTDNSIIEVDNYASFEKAMKFTGVSAGMTDYLSKLKLLMQYINLKGK